MALIIKVVGMKAFKGFVNKDGINSGTLGRFNRSSQHQVKLPILDTH